MEMNFTSERAEAREFYSSPRLRIVEVKTQVVLCQSRDIKDAGEDSEDIFGTQSLFNNYGIN